MAPGRDRTTWASLRISRARICSLDCSHGRDPQHLVGGGVPKRRDVTQLELAFGQRAGLVKGEDLDLGQPFERGAASLIRMPVPASRPRAATIVAGVARIRAHGHATTSTDRADTDSAGPHRADQGVSRPGPAKQVETSQCYKSASQPGR